MPSLRVREPEQGDEPAYLGRIVVRDRCLEVLADWRWLSELAVEPAEQAHCRLVGARRHGTRLLTVDTFLAIASRRDERRYLPDPLPSEVVERILDAGRLSGSGRNRQPWAFVLPESRERVEQLAETVNVPANVRAAGLVVAVLVSGRGPITFDAGRATQNMLLAAWNEGVAACPNGVDDPERARDVLDAGPDESVVIVLTFGLPERPRDIGVRSASEWSAAANRRSLADVVRHLR